ncbi:MAG: hypothetical protein ABSG13_28725 [Bryobacteraceae bacterium]|jgi:hypothetical protein
MSSSLLKASIALLSLALTASVGTWWSARQELQIVTAANASVRRTLGELMLAITEKDREIDRLTKSPCNAGERSQLGTGLAARGASQP